MRKIVGLNWCRSDAAKCGVFFLIVWVGRLRFPVVEQHLVRVPGVPVLGEVGNLARRVEPRNKAIDVAIVAPLQRFAVLRVLAHHVVAICQCYDIGEVRCAEVVGIDAPVQVAAVL